MYFKFHGRSAFDVHTFLSDLVQRKTHRTKDNISLFCKYNLQYIATIILSPLRMYPLFTSWFQGVSYFTIFKKSILSFRRNPIEKALKNIQLKFHDDRSIVRLVIAILRSACRAWCQCSIIDWESQRKKKSAENARLEKVKKIKSWGKLKDYLMDMASQIRQKKVRIWRLINF